MFKLQGVKMTMYLQQETGYPGKGTGGRREKKLQNKHQLVHQSSEEDAAPNPPLRSRYVKCRELTHLFSVVVIRKIPASESQESQRYRNWWPAYGFSICFTRAMRLQSRDPFARRKEERMFTGCGNSVKASDSASRR